MTSSTKCGAGPTVAIVDTSFLAHALLPSQQVPQAIANFQELRNEASPPVLTLLVVVEFYSLLRKLTTQGRLTATESTAYLDLLRHWTAVIDSPAELLDRAWEIAVRLGQSDVFDAYGYAASEWLDAEFWTSDGRFANAGTSAGLARIRLAG